MMHVELSGVPLENLKYFNGITALCYLNRCGTRRFAFASSCISSETTIEEEEKRGRINNPTAHITNDTINSIERHYA